MSYLLWLPSSYLLWHYGPDSSGDEGPKIPLMVYLHGAGGRELGDERMHKLWEEYPNPLNLSPTSGVEFPFILMMPHCPTGEEWAKGHMPDHVVDTIFQVASSHSIDSARIYLTGKSMGGEGTWKVAATSPRLFAAIVPMCGGMFPYGGKGAADYASRIIMPTWVFHAESDCMVLIDESEIAVEAVKQVNPQVRFTRYPDAPDALGHDCWTTAYGSPELHGWLLGHQNRELASHGLEWAREQTWR